MSLRASIITITASILICFCIFLVVYQKPSHSGSNSDLDTKIDQRLNPEHIGSSSASHEADSDDHIKPKNRRFIQTADNVRNDPENWFEEAKTLGALDISEEVATRNILSLLDRYAVITKDGGYPTGLNHEVINSLLGDNSKKIALLSISHPRINSEGELTDRWGTPYHFHMKSRQEASIRSAGADLVFYTEDDITSGAKGEE